MYCFGSNSGIWAESTESWDDALPSWKAVGSSPRRILRSEVVNKHLFMHSKDSQEIYTPHQIRGDDTGEGSTENITNEMIKESRIYDRGLLKQTKDIKNTEECFVECTLEKSRNYMTDFKKIELVDENADEFESFLYRPSIEHIFTQERSFYVVLFTSGRTAVVKSKQQYRPGSYVIVEADRGEDCAVVQAKLENTSSELSTLNNVKSVLRRASGQDVEFLKVRKLQEAKAFMRCTQLSAERNLPIEVTGCEFQWDMKKITFYFRSDRRVDFRELVKELFKFYRIRIWMSMENRKVI